MHSDNQIAETVVPPAPTPIPYTLLFEEYFSNGTGKYDYLHLVRSRHLFLMTQGRQIEERYWNDLNTNRHSFARQLTGTFDLLVDPPSNTGYHRPFFSAVAAQHQGIQRVHFKKDTSEQSQPSKLNWLRAGVAAIGQSQGRLGGCNDVLIIDDVFSTGTIATVVIEKLLEAGLSEQARITLACPLRMPPTDPLTADADAIERMVSEMAEEDAAGNGNRDVGE
jgi:hypothetical protein